MDLVCGHRIIRFIKMDSSLFKSSFPSSLCAALTEFRSTYFSRLFIIFCIFLLTVSLCLMQIPLLCQINFDISLRVSRNPLPQSIAINIALATLYYHSIDLNSTILDNIFETEPTLKFTLTYLITRIHNNFMVILEFIFYSSATSRY